MCRSCGAIVGAGQPQCAVCGTPASLTPEQLKAYRPADRETIRFARAVLNRPYIFTIVLLIANLFVFLLMWHSSGMTSQVLWSSFPEPVLVAYGAKLKYLINAPNNQWWRFITPMFIHVNLPHSVINTVGRLARCGERTSGLQAPSTSPFFPYRRLLQPPQQRPKHRGVGVHTAVFYSAHPASRIDHHRSKVD